MKRVRLLAIHLPFAPGISESENLTWLERAEPRRREPCNRALNRLTWFSIQRLAECGQFQSKRIPVRPFCAENTLRLNAEIGGEKGCGSFHADKHHLEGLFQRRLKVDPGERVALRIIRQCIGGTWIPLIPQLDKHLQDVLSQRSLRPRYVDGAGVKISGVHTAVGVDAGDVDDIATIRSAPFAEQFLKSSFDFD